MWGVVSGGGAEGDGQPECLELADVVADLLVGVGAGGVVAGPEVGVAGVGVGGQVPVALCPPGGFRRLFRVLG
jgi:hypothetical protein